MLFAVVAGFPPTASVRYILAKKQVFSFWRVWIASRSQNLQTSWSEKISRFTTLASSCACKTSIFLPRLRLQMRAIPLGLFIWARLHVQRFSNSFGSSWKTKHRLGGYLYVDRILLFENLAWYHTCVVVSVSVRVEACWWKSRCWREGSLLRCFFMRVGTFHLGFVGNSPFK